MKIKTPALLVLACGLLGACGIRGDLETPAPLWGKANPDVKADTLPDDQVKQETADGLPQAQDATGPIDQNSTSSTQTDNTDTPNGG